MSCAAYFGWDNDLQDELATEESKEQERVYYQERRAKYLGKLDDAKEAIKESKTALKDPNLSREDRHALKRKIKFHKQMTRMHKKSLRSIEWQEDVRTKRNHSLWFKFKYELYVWWMVYVYACASCTHRNRPVYPVTIDQADPADLVTPADSVAAVNPVGQVGAATEQGQPETSQES